jgi:lipopolysaccharide/colanic/teichoic acid biosynthesis glycosyltransferase
MTPLTAHKVSRILTSLTFGAFLGLGGGAFLAAIDAASAWFYVLGIGLVGPIVLQGLYEGHGLPPLVGRSEPAKPNPPIPGDDARGWGERRRERILYLGHQSSFARFSQVMNRHRRFRRARTVVGFIRVTGGPDVSHGNLGIMLPGLVQELRVDRIVVELNDLSELQQRILIREVAMTGVQLSSVPAGWAITRESGSPVRLSPLERAAKRTLDVVVASLGIIVLFPTLVVVALAIKLESRGPVLFEQRRVGRGGKTFRLLKFRTMVTHAEELKEHIRELNAAEGGLFKITADPRITRVGRLLRRTSLDELPQLLNVLRGDMSLVGPRPLLPDEYSLIRSWQRPRHASQDAVPDDARLALQPGMTGYWHVLAPRSLPRDERLKLDQLYVTNWSLWRDLALLFRGLLVPLTRPPLYREFTGVRRRDFVDQPHSDESPGERTEPPDILVATRE